MIGKNFRISAAIAALICSTSLSVSVQAQDYLSGVERIVIDNNGRLIKGTVTTTGDIVDSSGQVVGHAVSGMLDASGNIVDTTGKTITRVVTTYPDTSTTKTTTITTTEPAAVATPVWMTDALVSLLDDRRILLEHLINHEMSKGAITSGKAGEFRFTLKNIESAEIADKASGGGMGYDEAVDIGRNLDSLCADVCAAASLPAISPLVLVDPAGVTRFSVAPTYVATSVPTATTTRVTETTTTTPTGTITIRSVSPDILVTTLDTRRRELYRLLTEAQDRNALSAAQAAPFLTELERVHTQIVPNITYGRAVILARDLDTLGGQIVTFVPAVPQPIIAGSHLTISNGQIAELDDVAVRRSDLEGRIAKEAIQGRLKPGQVSQLRDQMDAIETMEANFRANSGGNLSLKEGRILYDNFDKVAEKLDHWAGPGNQ